MASAFRTIIGGSIGAQLVVVCAGVVLARTYSPAAFGELGFYASIAALVSVVSGLRLDHIAFTGQSAKDAPNYLSTTLLIAFSVTVLVTLFLGAASFLEVVRPLSICIVFAYTLATSCYYLFGQFDLYTGQYQRFAKSRFIQSVLYGTIPFILLRTHGQQGLTIGVVSSLIIACIYYSLINREIITPNFKNSASLLSSKWRSAIRNTGTTLLQYSTPFAPVILGSGFANQNEVGAYFLFTQMIAAPFSLLRRALINFYNAEFNKPELAKTSLKKNKKTLILFSLILGLTSAIIALTINTHGRLLINIIIGERWQGMAHFLIPMIIYFSFDALLQPTTTLLPHWGKSALLFKLELTRFILVYLFGALLTTILNWSFFQYSLFFFGSMLLIYFIEAFCLALIIQKTRNEN